MLPSSDAPTPPGRDPAPPAEPGSVTGPSVTAEDGITAIAITMRALHQALPMGGQPARDHWCTAVWDCLLAWADALDASTQEVARPRAAIDALAEAQRDWQRHDAMGTEMAYSDAIHAVVALATERQP